MSLYSKSKLLTIRKKYRKNIKRKYGEVEKNFQRCHIFGLREAKHIELCLKIQNIEILEYILTWEENVVFLTQPDHKLFEKNKLVPNKLTKIQKILLQNSIKLKKMKYRKFDKNICLEIYEVLENIYNNKKSTLI